MKKKILGFLLSLILVGCGSKETYEQQITQYNLLVKEAEKFSDNNEFDKAILSAEAAIKITDTLSPALLQNGYAYLNLKNWEEAKDNFSDAIDIDGDKSISYRGRAIANYFSDEKSDFIDDVNTYLKYNEGDEYAHLLRGDYHSDEEDFDDAIADYSICLKFNPNNESYYLKRGNAYAMSDKNIESIADYESYTRLTPGKNNDEIFYKRASLNSKVKKFQNSIDDLVLISNYNQKPAVLELMADNYSKLGNHSQAVINYSHYLQIKPKDFEVFKKRATTYTLQNNLKSANKDFTEAAELEWSQSGYFYKYGYWILFVIMYLFISLLFFNTVKDEYDNKKIRKGYFYYLFSGIFGGHHAYTNGLAKYFLLVTCVLAFSFINIFNFRSYFSNSELLWSGILATNASLYLLYAIIALLILDFILLPYYVFSENHKFRLAINDQSANLRSAEILTISKNIKIHNSNLKKLNL